LSRTGTGEENATAGDIQQLAADDGSDPRSGRLIA
jgi:hypothetical protein